ncbi:hypothetical protein [Reinekea forsetii]|uniref:Uncharacterized protein n=1 Tax=Reinekea forsetii TaxID=1336806 RepID=A0A2K8KSD8_9GAMM|nr:hypothetical protein [Reinekea forsetii]ATX76989.1 hypothetical protein REIFOR_01852 [Reinekea forsetii]
MDSIKCFEHEKLIDRLDLSEELPSYWRKLVDIAFNAIDLSCVLRTRIFDQTQAAYSQYKRFGYLPDKLLRDCLAMHQYTGILFFSLLYKDQKLRGCRPPSPVATCSDPTWMNQSSFCFFNVRATDIELEQTGNLIDATRLLPILRAGAIHMAPFFQSIFGIVYAQDSFKIISDDVTNSFYEAIGVSRYDQLRYFIDCCHLTNKAVGYDMTPHTATFSKLSFDRPELFRWLRWSPDYQSLYQDMPVEEQYQETIQRQYVRDIADLASKTCDIFSIGSLEDTQADIKRLDAAHQLVRDVIRQEGYFPMVPHTWNGIGLPGIKLYDHERNHPVWDYRNLEGEDQSEHGIGLHSLFKFHTNLKPNSSPFHDGSDPQSLDTPSYQPTMDFLTNLFPEVHREYGFDFLRVDYQDHVFRNRPLRNGQEVIVCEQLTCSQLLDISNSARQAFPAAGMLADHMGTDIERYRKAGFITILGDEVKFSVNQDKIEKMFKFNAKLAQLSIRDPSLGAPALAMDTHDLGHPMILGMDLPMREERSTFLLRLFLSRFSTGGIGNRPKYETLGNQDFSSGIYRCNNQPGSLKWGEDRVCLSGYHRIEDLYALLKTDLQHSMLLKYRVYEQYSWWLIAEPEIDEKYLFFCWFERETTAGANSKEVICNISSSELPAFIRYEVVQGFNLAAQSTNEFVLSDEQFSLVPSSGSNIRLTWPMFSSWVLRLEYK